MDECLHIPKDFESRTAFRLLEGRVGKGPAVAWLLLLFRDLAYAAQSNPLGVLPAGQVELLNRALAECHSRSETEKRGNGETASESVAQGTEPSASPAPRLTDSPIQILLACDNLLVAVEGGYYCATFTALNRHLSPDHVSMQKIGGVKRGVEKRAQQIEREAAQQAVLIDPKLFTRPDGTDMDRDETKRTVMLVRMIDQHLGKPSRLQAHFTPGLVQDAYQVLQKYDEEKIMRFCTWLTIQRTRPTIHPSVPKTTEEILRDFDQYADVKLS